MRNLRTIFFYDIAQIKTVQIRPVTRYKSVNFSIKLHYSTIHSKFSIKIMGKSINEKELGELQGEGGSDVFTTTRHINHNQQQQVSNETQLNILRISSIRFWYFFSFFR